jgi:hypothetical protein
MVLPAVGNFPGPLRLAPGGEVRLLNDELAVGDMRVAGLVNLPIEELFALGDSPLAYALRRRKGELDRSDTLVAGHDSSAG